MHRMCGRLYHDRRLRALLTLANESIFVREDVVFDLYSRPIWPVESALENSMIALKCLDVYIGSVLKEQEG